MLSLVRCNALLSSRAAGARRPSLPISVRGPSESRRVRTSIGPASAAARIPGRPTVSGERIAEVVDADARYPRPSGKTKERTTTTTRTRNYDVEERIRDAVRVAVYGVLHREALSLRALAETNGYEPVRIDEEHRRVQLAEGVIARARGSVDEEFAVFARPTRKRKGSSAARKDHPQFLEEDFTLYRIMERSVEDQFEQWENSVWEWYRSKMDVAERKMDAAKRAVDLAYAPVSNLIAKHRSVGNAIVVNDSFAHAGGEHFDKKNGKMTSCSKTEAPVNDDILVISKQDGRSLLVQDVPRQYRLLILPATPSFQPYDLRFLRSGTVIYTGLVLFGAVPLTYRSLNYAVDYAEYPAIGNTMIASVAASVSYSLWASRRSARTRQSLAVGSAVASRTVARDDAIEAQLKDEACKTIADAVMNEYLSRRDGKGGSDGEGNRKLAAVISKSNLDPINIATNLGLLQEKDSSGRDLVAVDVDIVSAQILGSLARHVEKCPPAS